jgi:hypothetical protein
MYRDVMKPESQNDEELERNPFSLRTPSYLRDLARHVCSSVCCEALNLHCFLVGSWSKMYMYGIIDVGNGTQA